VVQFAMRFSVTSSCSSSRIYRVMQSEMKRALQQLDYDQKSQKRGARLDALLYRLKV
jgi:hypothetical protein